MEPTQAIAPGAVPSESQRTQEIAQAQQQIQQQVRSMAARDREVRTHEQAHASVGGAYASAPHYQYERAPNGVSYAVSGHVNIDVAPVPGDPAETLKKMQVVQRAALAVAQPSAADRAVAAQAAAQAAEARAELARSRRPDPTELRGVQIDISV